MARNTRTILAALKAKEKVDLTEIKGQQELVKEQIKQVEAAKPPAPVKISRVYYSRLPNLEFTFPFSNKTVVFTEWQILKDLIGGRYETSDSTEIYELDKLALTSPSVFYPRSMFLNITKGA